MSILYPVKHYLFNHHLFNHLKAIRQKPASGLDQIVLVLFRFRGFLAAMGVGWAIAIVVALIAVPAHSLTVEGDRWLSIAQLQGNVELIPFQGVAKQAQVGDRLASVGDMLVTNANSSARLVVDQQAGAVSMAENTELQVSTLSITSRGGRITVINVLRGQVRMTVRSLTNPDSRLEIHTPAGISGVRGTDFGVTVQSGGRTGVATSEGSVYAIAQGATVSVDANLQTTIEPGRPPEPPEPLRDDPTVFISALSALPGSIPDNPMARVVGMTDAVNLIQINDDPKLLNREGRFDVVVPMSAAGRVRMSVLTPLGTEQQYELVVP